MPPLIATDDGGVLLVLADIASASTDVRLIHLLPGGGSIGWLHAPPGLVLERAGTVIRFTEAEGCVRTTPLPADSSPFFDPSTDPAG